MSPFEAFFFLMFSSTNQVLVLFIWKMYLLSDLHSQSYLCCMLWEALKSKRLSQWEGQGVYIKSSLEMQTYNFCSTSFWAFSASIKGGNWSSWRNKTWVFTFVLAALQVFHLTLDTCFHMTAWTLWTDNTHSVLLNYLAESKLLSQCRIFS